MSLASWFVSRGRFWPLGPLGITSYGHSQLIDVRCLNYLEMMNQFLAIFYDAPDFRHLTIADFTPLLGASDRRIESSFSKLKIYKLFLPKVVATLKGFGHHMSVLLRIHNIPPRRTKMLPVRLGVSIA